MVISTCGPFRNYDLCVIQAIEAGQIYVTVPTLD